MSENPVNRDRSRHVDVKFHFLRERVRAGEIKLYECWGPLTADRDKIEFRLFNSSSILIRTLREELFSLPKQN